ncbi:MAG: hypothetical protein GY859_36825, partial [Desulfobacterales bacterium]|nr:hypothetical protein [Desulfobacterales bacterium]
MLKLKDIGMKRKLTMFFLLVGLVPLLIVGGYSSWLADEELTKTSFNQLEAVRGIKKAQIEKFFSEREGDMGVLMETVNTLRTEAVNKLTAVREIKKNQIEGFFRERQGDMGVLMETVAMLQQDAFQKLEAIQELKKAQIEDLFENMTAQVHVVKGDPYVTRAMLEFNQAFEDAGDRVDTAEWKAVAERYDSRMKDIMADNGWYDLFLIHTDGDVVYTVSRESDMGMSIPDSELKNSGLGKAYNLARSMKKDDIAAADFEPYAPSNGAQAAFMMGQLSDEAGNVKGYVAIQAPADRINRIVQRRQGMGRTGETYLVGELDGKSAYRSDRVVKSGKIGQKKSGAEIDKALAGKSNIEVKTGSTGDLEIVGYTPLELDGFHWVMINSMDFEEAIAQKLEGEKKDFYAKYIEKYGYYDLFIIHPGGKVFYSVTREADYGTNMVNGKYKDSNLGALVREVLKTGEFGLADFAPYAPSNGEPASFIAQPVIYNGEVEVIVALQLSLDAINKIMTERSGLGETGETYLIGPDKLMRSDSFLDPENHSVMASFARPEKGSVDTEAAREALAGKSGANVILDYNGSPVLSAYTPVQLKGVTWGLLAEIDVAEAFCPKDADGVYFFEKYNNMYGYYDLFLITPDGYVFYTVSKEADYQTNMVNGKYADSGLGKLARNVMESKKFGFAD